MAKRKDQMHHDTMVQHVASALAQEEFERIRADLSGYEEPEPLTWEGTGVGYLPDVTGEKDGVLHIYEVETIDTIDDAHAEAQWKLFAKCAAERGGKFILVVSHGVESSANARLRQLGIEAEVRPVRVR